MPTYELDIINMTEGLIKGLKYDTCLQAPAVNIKEWKKLIPGITDFAVFFPLDMLTLSLMSLELKTCWF